MNIDLIYVYDDQTGEWVRLTSKFFSNKQINGLKDTDEIDSVAKKSLYAKKTKELKSEI